MKFINLNLTLTTLTLTFRFNTLRNKEEYGTYCFYLNKRLAFFPSAHPLHVQLHVGFSPGRPHPGPPQQQHHQGGGRGHNQQQQQRAMVDIVLSANKNDVMPPLTSKHQR